MAKKKKTTATQVKRYPWEKWFKKRRKFTLVKGKDFNCQPHGMAQQIRSRCRRQTPPLSANISVENGDLIIKFTERA